MAPTAVFRGRIASVAALPRWRAALAARHVAPADVVCVGDSITEGTGASARETRWLDVLQVGLRSAFPTQLAPGGAGYVPAYTMSDYPPGWAYYGNIGANGTFGLGRRSVVLKSPDGAIARSVYGTSVVLAWTSGPNLGTFRVLVDGTVVGSNVATANSAGATGGNRLTVSLGTRGLHTVRVEWVSGGDVYFNGMFVRDGDETRGIRVIDSGQHGSSSADWSRLTSPGTAYILGQELAVIAPALVVLGLGPNDMIQGLTPASHLANMRDIIAMIRTNAPGADILLHAAYQLAADYTYPWSSYVANLYTLRDETPNTALLDFSRQLPRANANPFGMIAADGVHLNDAGDQFYAARFRGQLLDPHAPRSDYATVNDVALKADDTAVVHLAGTETITGAKTFNVPPQVPVGNLLANPVRRDDARLTDARTPTAHAASHATGGADAITPASIGAAAASRVGPGFMGTFMVRDYAADPNAAGSGAAGQDDTAAINAAMAAALAYQGRGGGRVLFDSGTWQTSAIIEHPETITVEGIYQDTITYSGGAASPCVIRPLSSHPGTAIWRMRGKAETGRTYDHTGARLRHLTMQGDRTPSGTKGLLLLGLVREAEIDHVTIQDSKDTAFDLNANASNIGPQSCRLAHCLADGAGNNGYRFANVPDTTLTDCNSLGATNQGFLFQGFMNGQGTNLRAEWSGQHGFLFSSGYWGTGQGSGGMILTNITTDRNGMNGVYVDSTCRGSGTLQFNGLTCRRDGRGVNAAGGGSYAGFAVDSANTMPVVVDNLSVYPGVDDGGGGTLSPQFGVNCPGTTTPVVISSGYVHAATTALNVGSACLVDSRIGTATGPTASPTRVAPVQATGGGAHAATHAIGGSDVLTPDAIGAVASTLRGPIGGSAITTGVTGTVTLDPTGPPLRRWAIAGATTVSVPASGVDGQTIVIWALSDSATNRVLTFASGFELAPNIAGRAFTITNSVLQRFEIECRNGTGNNWVLTRTSVVNGLVPPTHATRHATGGADPLAPADIGAAPKLNVRTITATTATAAPGDLLVLDATSNAIAITAPSAPAAGDSVDLLRIDATGNGVTWSGTTHNDTSGAVLSGQWTSARLTWTGSTWYVAYTNAAIPNPLGSASTVSSPTAAGPFTSNTQSEVNVTAAGVVFVAPPSGKVVLTISAWMVSGAAGTAIYVSPNILTGTTIGSGTTVLAPASANGLSNNNAQYIAASTRIVVTGLTPGASYNAFPSIRSSGTASTQTTANHRIIVEPQAA
jgi:lysophospholipase L1-like esterase